MGSRGGDVAMLLLFAAIGMDYPFSTSKPSKPPTLPLQGGFCVHTYFLGGYCKEGLEKNGLQSAVVSAAKSWSLGVPLGIHIRALSVRYLPPTDFMLVTMVSTAVLLIGWRALFSTIFPYDKGEKNHLYRRGSPFEPFELLTSLVRRW